MFPEIEYRQFDPGRNFGIELEIANSSSQKKLWQVVESTLSVPALYDLHYEHSNGNYWHVKRDYSCGRKGGKNWGFEVASPKGDSVEDLLNFGKMADAIYDKGWRVNNNCGFHVHVDISDFQDRHVGAMIAWWLKIESIIFQLVPQRRRQSSFCLPLQGKYLWPDGYQKYWIGKFQEWHESGFGYFGGLMYEVFKPKDTNLYLNNEKHFALNLVPYARARSLNTYQRCTVELRLPEGTLDGEAVKNWIRLFVSFVNTCKTRRMPKNMEEITDWPSLFWVLGLQGDSKLFIIPSDGLLETKAWILKRARKYSAHADVRASATNMLNEILSPAKNYC